MSQPPNATPNLADCHALVEAGRVTEAIAGFAAILAESPGNPTALNGIAGGLQSLGRHTESISVFFQLLRVAQKPLAWRVASNYLMGLQYAAVVPAVQLAADTATLGQQFGVPDEGAPPPTGTVHAPLRIGFVSPDLCDHPVGLLLLPLLLCGDRSRFTPLLYSTGGREDETRDTLRRFSSWHEVSQLDHEALLARLRADQLDVLVDLSGHTAGNRLPVFARRAAPLQVSWLGYFATTGIAAMDCVLMDPWHVPTGHEDQFTEQVLRMPHSRFCYQPAAFAPEVAPPPCLASGYVTFGSFNNTAKYSEQLFAVWARILVSVPGSRLVLKWRTFADPVFGEQVMAGFEALGVARDRIELRPASFHKHVLEQYADIDIALDPFPFTGGHTSCEALWMGVPVVTLAGERPVSRQTLSLIGSLGRSDWLQEWVAQDVDGYVERAVALASNPLALAQTRQSLRHVMRSSPLMDGRRFAADFLEVISSRREAVFEREKGLQPASGARQQLSK